MAKIPASALSSIVTTTIDLPRTVHAEAKIAGIQRGMSLKTLVTLALQSYLVQTGMHV